MNPSDWWGHSFGVMWTMPLLFLAVSLFFMRSIFGQGNADANTALPLEAHVSQLRNLEQQTL
jgi:hypothetical protein